MFLGGLAVVVLALQSGIGTYDDTLFWDHMVQHLMLVMAAPPLLIFGQPITLLMHASRNPLHTWVKKLIRSKPANFLTWPVFGFAAYAAAIVIAHLTGLANLTATNQAAHETEHVAFLVIGYLFFLPIIGSEPIKWKLSYPTKLRAPLPGHAGRHVHRPGPHLRQQEPLPAWSPAPAQRGLEPRSGTCTRAAR